MHYAIIGGTGVYDPKLLENLRTEQVRTPYGAVSVQVGTYEGVEIGFMPRHGQGHSIAPHKINYRANIWALKSLGAANVLATAAVGSLNPEMRPGHFVIIDQFLDFTKFREHTFFEGGEEGVVHTDVTHPYCPTLRRALFDQAKNLGLPTHRSGVYVCTEGPRFETAAEIKAYRILGGDVVGMTNVPESVLAREAGICYATMCMVTNMGAGISENPLTHEEVVEIMAANTEHVRRLALGTIAALEAAPPAKKSGAPFAPAAPGAPVGPSVGAGGAGDGGADEPHAHVTASSHRTCACRTVQSPLKGMGETRAE